jgi:hypothetical protein
MRRWMRRVAIGFLVAAVGLEGIYLIAANAFLNTRLAPQTINRRPRKFEIAWRSGWSLWPGLVVLHDVRTRGSSKRVDWYAHLDTVNASVHLLPLLRREVDLTSVRATGVDFRHRRRWLPVEIPRSTPEEQPPVPLSLGISPARPESPPRPKSSKPPWTIRADRIVCDVEQLWLDRFRLTGPMRVETPMRLVVRGEMEFPWVRVTMPSGSLRAGHETIFDGLGIDVEATVHPFIPKKSRGLAFFRHLSGRYSLRSESASLFFLEAYFRKTPWLRFNDRGSGRMEMRLDHGRLRPGSTLEVSNDHVDLQIIDRHLTGKGVITGTVGEKDGVLGSQLTARLSDFQVAPIGSSEPFARGKIATVVARSTKMDLSDPFTDVSVVLDVPRSEILDLSFYNSLIPEGSQFRLLSGAGTLSYHLEGSSEARSLHGNIDLNVTSGAAQFRNFVMRGGFDLRTRLRQASPREMLFDISGTRLGLSTRNPEAWSAVFTFPKAQMRFSEPMKIDAAVRLQMQDTRPLVVMFDALKGIPDRLERFLIIQDVHGGAVLEGGRGHVVVKDLDVTGKGLHALADLVLGKSSKEGILYIRFHGFSLGVEIAGGGRDLKVFRPLHWFQQQRERRRRDHP